MGENSSQNKGGSRSCPPPKTPSTPLCPPPPHWVKKISKKQTWECREDSDLESQSWRTQKGFCWNVCLPKQTRKARVDSSLLGTNARTCELLFLFRHQALQTILLNKSNTTFLKHKSSHTAALHWLHLKLRIEAISLEMAHKALRDRAPDFLSELSHSAVPNSLHCGHPDLLSLLGTLQDDSPFRIFALAVLNCLLIPSICQWPF